MRKGYLKVPNAIIDKYRFDSRLLAYTFIVDSRDDHTQSFPITERLLAEDFKLTRYAARSVMADARKSLGWEALKTRQSSSTKVQPTDAVDTGAGGDESTKFDQGSTKEGFSPYVVKEVIKNPLAKYSESFEIFWKQYPNSWAGSKQEAFKAWKDIGVENEGGVFLNSMIQHVYNYKTYHESCMALNKFCAQLPHAVRYLKRKMWETPVPTAQPPQPPHGGRRLV